MQALPLAFPTLEHLEQVETKVRRQDLISQAAATASVMSVTQGYLHIAGSSQSLEALRLLQCAQHL